MVDHLELFLNMCWFLQMNVDNVGSFVFEDASLFPAAKVRNCCTQFIPSP